MDDVAISVRGISKVYSQGEAAMRALSDVDLDVRRGEMALLMGPSGSGKTTLLSIMGCILRPSAGSIRVMGRDVTALPERDLPRVRLEHIGFVFQGFNLFPTLTAQANVALALDLRGVPRSVATRRAAELLDQVGLAAKLDAYPADLSGGQKQRVAIARAIAGDPPILLADEPTAALDTQSGHAVMELMQRLAHDRGRAVVIVTHDARMLGYADRSVHIEDGRIVRADARGVDETRMRADVRGVDEARMYADVRGVDEARMRAAARGVDETRMRADARGVDGTRMRADAGEVDGTGMYADVRESDEARMHADARAMDEARMYGDPNGSDGTRIQADRVPAAVAAPVRIGRSQVDLCVDRHS